MPNQNVLPLFTFLSSVFFFCLLPVEQIQRTAARDAEERYRKELESHAGAITALRNVEDSLDVSYPTPFVVLSPSPLCRTPRDPVECVQGCRVITPPPLAQVFALFVHV